MGINMRKDWQDSQSMRLYYGHGQTRTGRSLDQHEAYYGD